MMVRNAQTIEDFEKAVQDFIVGSDDYLYEKKFVEHLPHHVMQNLKNDEEREVYSLLDRLCKCTLNEEVAIREKALMTVAVINNLSLGSKNSRLMRHLFGHLVTWIERENIYIVGYAVICQQLQRMGVELMRNNFGGDVQVLLEVLQKIDRGELAKIVIIKNMVGDIHRYLKSQKNLEKKEEESDEVKNIAKEVQVFRGGNVALLHDKEFVEQLPHHIMQLFQGGQEKLALSLIDRLGECVLSNTVAKREKALVVIAVLNNLSIRTENVVMMKNLFFHMVRWLEFENVYLVGAAVICQQLQRSGLELLRHEYWQEVEDLLEVIFRIEHGKLEKNDIIKKMTINIREYIASQDILENLIHIYEDKSEEKPKSIENIVKYFGNSSALFLLEKVVLHEDEKSCLKLLNILPGSGQIEPVLAECLKNDPPWHVIKNVICIVSEIGKPELYFLVESFIDYPDIRVQQEVVKCITKIGGEEMLPRLKNALETVDEELKGRLVMMLGQYESENLSDIFLDILFKIKDRNDGSAERLQLTICVALRSFPYPSVVNLLQHFAKRRLQFKGKGDNIIWAVDETIKILEPKIRHSRSNEDENVASVSYDDDPEGERGAKMIVRSLLEKAKMIAKKGNKEEAGDFLFRKAVEAANEKDFQTAELLSDKILNINPNALAKVIRIGEIIDKEKATSITSHQLDIWRQLYENMTTEEFNAFYYAMKNQRFDAGEVIVKSGEIDPCLYFIHSGLVRMMCTCGESETFLKRLQPGDVAGVGQFFSASVWTVSLVAQDFVRLQVLERGKYYKLIDEYPGIESKLKDYCVVYNTVPELVRMTGNDRREFPRYEASVMVSSILLDAYGRKGKRVFKGEMIDISRGGLSFYIRVSKKEFVKMLLGRQIISEIYLDKENKLKCHGVVVGTKISDMFVTDISVHVRLYRNIDQAQVIQVTRLQKTK